MKYFHIFILSLLLGSKMLLADSSSIKSLDTIDQTIQDALEIFHVPGAAVGLIVNDQIILSKGYGYRDLDQKLNVSENTLFSIGSCTKAFTSFLIGQLVDEGKISWDDPVFKHLAEFRLFNADLTSQVTIRDLLAHRTGIPRNDALWFFVELTRPDILNLLQHFEPTFGLRESYLYNNLMYTVAGLLCEKLTGLSWEEAISKKLFLPLGMNHSILTIKDQPEDFSLPYAEIDGTIREIPFHEAPCIWPGGGIYSNVKDMVKWLRIQLSKENSLIQAETLQEMHTTQISFPSSFSLPAGTGPEISLKGYGFGWMIGSYKNHHFLTHNGTLDGFFSEVSLLPNDKIGLVILTNSSSDGVHLVSYLRNLIFDKLLEINASNWKEQILENRIQSKQALSKNETQIADKLLRPLKEYAGIYSHPAYGNIYIRIENNQLLFSYQHLIFPLSFISNETFEGVRFNQLLYFGINPFVDVSFKINSQMQVCELHLPFEGFRNAKPIIFKKTNLLPF